MTTHILTVAEQADKADIANPLISRERRRIFAETYAVTGSVKESCQKAGISDGTARYWLRDPRFIASIFGHRQAKLSGEASSLAYKVLLEICTERDSSGAYLAATSERRLAAIALLRLGGHSEALAAQAVTAQTAAGINDLSEDQLRAHISQAQAVLDALQGGDVHRVTLRPTLGASLL